ncbi:MAG: twin-arginine translocation signal domain-containing protein [Candidatus Aenigmarchaeota archaeon]|nr:twin-arginine translocation signal domain-containing protein [Candidatus Aenigmarchaeota archaeon]
MNRRNFIKDVALAAASLALPSIGSYGRDAETGIYESGAKGFAENAIALEKRNTPREFVFDAAMDKLSRFRDVIHKRYDPHIGSKNLHTIYRTLREKPFSFVFNGSEDGVLLLSEGFEKGMLDCDTSSFLYLDVADIEHMPVFGVKTRGTKGQHFHIRWINYGGGYEDYQSNRGYFGWAGPPGSPTKAEMNSPAKKEVKCGVYRRTLSRRECVSEIYYNIGLNWAGFGNTECYRKAAGFFKKAAELDRRNVNAHFMLSVSLENAEEYGEALEAAAKSTLGRRPEFVKNYIRLYRIANMAYGPR